MFSQPELSPEQTQRRNFALARRIAGLAMVAAVAWFTGRDGWIFLIAPVGLLLIFGPVIFAQLVTRPRPPRP